MNVAARHRLPRALVGAVSCWFLLAAAGVAHQPAPVPGEGATPVADVGPAATPEPAPTPLPPVVAADPYVLAFLNPYPANPFWQRARAAVEARAVEDGVRVDVFDLATPSAADQLAQMTEVVAAGYDGIIFGPLDAVGAAPAALAAAEAGVPLLALDTEPAAGRIVSLVGTDDVAAAAAGAAFIAAAIAGEGTVLDLRGDMTTAAAQDRERGLRTALARFPEIQVQAEDAAWDPSLALNLVEAALPPVVDGTPPAVGAGPSAIFAASDPMALAALDVVFAAGREDLVVIGVGGTADALAAVASGELTATVAEFPDRMGSLGVDLLVRHLNGEPVPPRVDSGFALVTLDNVERFLDQESDVGG